MFVPSAGSSNDARVTRRSFATGYTDFGFAKASRSPPARLRISQNQQRQAPDDPLDHRL